MYRKEKMPFYCMAALTAFMILFTAWSLIISPNSAYKMSEYELFHLTKFYKEIITPVAMRMFMQILVLAVVSWIVYRLFLNLELPTVSVIVPLFILLTISVVLINYVRSAGNSWRHFSFLIAGLVLLVAGCFISKTICYADYRQDIGLQENSGVRDRGTKRDKHMVPRFLKAVGRIGRIDNLVLFFIQAVTVIFALWIFIGGYILHIAVNGAYGIINIAQFSITPVEWLKLLIMLYTGIALVRLRLDNHLRKKFYIWMLISLAAVFASRDIGNLFILLSLAGLILYLLDNKMILLAATGILALMVILGYVMYSFGMFPSSSSYMVTRFLSVFTTATEADADSSRIAMLASLRDGILGTGTANKMYLDNVFMIFTDYAFLAVQTMFGIGISALVIMCYALLYMGPRIAFRDAGEDPITYVYANTLTAVLGVQTIVHVAVNLNIFPFTGVVLPFISAGGTSTLMCFLCLGLSLGVRMGDEPYKKVLRLCHIRG